MNKSPVATNDGSEPNPLNEYAGLEWIVEAFMASPGRLRDLDVIRSTCQQIVDDLDLNVVGTPQFHPFPGPGGVTALYLLSESHLACHTYPEHSLATFNLYCCGNRRRWDWETELTNRLQAGSVSVRCVKRGEAVHEAGLENLRQPAGSVGGKP